MRIGHGYDLHALADSRRLVLGGVDIPHGRGPIAHSDGDVLLHALCDALLGAAGLGDIGRHFPDSNDDYRDIDSRILVRSTRELLAAQDLTIQNADLTVVAQQPKLAPYLADMRTHIAADLQIDMSRVNVKATTTEGMGFTGREEGIAAYAVVLLDE